MVAICSNFVLLHEFASYDEFLLMIICHITDVVAIADKVDLSSSDGLPTSDSSSDSSSSSSSDSCSESESDNDSDDCRQSRKR